MCFHLRFSFLLCIFGLAKVFYVPAFVMLAFILSVLVKRMSGREELLRN